jgi:aspartyl-tRNA(Asn)/glutamyl-tRNA(Gln) amidotransferase subunit A
MTAPLTLADAAQRIGRRELSPVELVQAALDRIAAIDGDIQAFVVTFGERALADAHAAEREIAGGRHRGPLHGVPVAVKDVFDVAGVPTRGGSPALGSVPAAEDATVTARLREAGAILVGKTHTHELAFGVLTPPTRNPWNLDHAPGGSSGGSAAAVAAAEVPLALGSDTGGSIRGPAAACGVVGLKPTYGRVSGHGVLCNSWSLDTVGLLARTVPDAAACLSVLAGWDSQDPRTSRAAVPDYGALLDGPLDGLRIGLPLDYGFGRLDPDVDAAVRGAVAEMESLGARCVEVELPLTHLYRATIVGIQGPEISGFHREVLRENAGALGPVVRTALEAAALLPAHYHVRAHQARRLICQAWHELFAGIDVLVMPTYPLGAPRVDQRRMTWPDGVEEPLLEAYARLTMPMNLSGVPCISIPCGLTRGGLPIGLQIAGRPFDEATVLHLAYRYEQTGAWERIAAEQGDPAR